jgi:hypothetical protein
MRRFTTFLFGFMLGGVTVYLSLHYHVVRTDSGMHLVPKLQSTFSETYVDIRGFGVDKWDQHRLLAAAITRAGKTELFHGVIVQSMPSGVDEFFKNLERP